MLNEVVDRIEAPEAPDIRSCCLYCTPRDARGQRVTLSDGGSK